MDVTERAVTLARLLRSGGPTATDDHDVSRVYAAVWWAVRDVTAWLGCPELAGAVRDEIAEHLEGSTW